MLALSLLKNLGKISLKIYQHSLSQPEVFQAKKWKLIFDSISKSKFWSGRIFDDLKDNPITTYEDYEEIIKKDYDFNVSSLNNEEIQYWIKSGGTTGESKFFPMTSTYNKDCKSIVKPFIGSLYSRYEKLGRKKILYFVSTRDSSADFSTGINSGYMSTFTYDSLPKLIQNLYAIPSEILEDADVYEQNYLTYVLSQDLSAMFAVTPLSYIRLIQDIHSKFDDVLHTLETEKSKFKISSKRLDYLKTLSLDSDFLLTQLWPSLEFLVCWQSSLCQHQLVSIQKHLKGLDLVDAIYSASEGWINCPIYHNEVGGPISLESGIFEFIEQGQNSKEEILKPWELEIGKNYDLLITNSMGLVRYRINDLVRCFGFVEKTPKIYFESKSNQLISLGLVTLSSKELEESLLKSCKTIKQSWRFATSKGGDGLVLYVLEQDSEMKYLASEIDKNLQAISSGYQTYRANGYIKNIVVEIVSEKNCFWMKDRHAQSKPSLLLPAQSIGVSHE